MELSRTGLWRAESGCDGCPCCASAGAVAKAVVIAATKSTCVRQRTLLNARGRAGTKNPAGMSDICRSGSNRRGAVASDDQMVMDIGASCGTGESPQIVRDSKRRGSRLRAKPWEGAVLVQPSMRSAAPCIPSESMPRPPLPLEVWPRSTEAQWRCIRQPRDSNWCPRDCRTGRYRGEAALWSDRCWRGASVRLTQEALHELARRTSMATVPLPYTVQCRSPSTRGSAEH